MVFHVIIEDMDTYTYKFDHIYEDTLKSISIIWALGKLLCMFEIIILEGSLVKVVYYKVGGFV